MSRILKYNEAIREATDQAMANDQSVFVLGLGATDPKGVFGTTLGLADKHGSKRVLDMPTSENGMTGVAIGAALTGGRPIMVHQRMDFALLAIEQIVNQAAKWRYMFAGTGKVPLVIRMIIGRGWGQGPQHSQSLHAWFAHIPGLKVVAPATAYDAKGLLVASIEDDDPIIFIEHRWLHGTFGDVPEELYRVPIGKARICRTGHDVTIVAISHMVIEAMQAAAILTSQGIDAEVIDVRTLRPLDKPAIIESVRRTRRLVVADTGWKTGGFSAEVIAEAVDGAFDRLLAAPRRVALLDVPTPSTPALARYCYPRAADIVHAVGETMGRSLQVPEDGASPLDVPDQSFSGPF